MGVTAVVYDSEGGGEVSGLQKQTVRVEVANVHGWGGC